jgi:hypothetical protein
MERMKASDFPQELLNLLDGYVQVGSAAGNSWMVRKNLPLAA